MTGFAAAAKRALVTHETEAKAKYGRQTEETTNAALADLVLDLKQRFGIDHDLATLRASINRAGPGSAAGTLRLDDNLCLYWQWRKSTVEYRLQFWPQNAAMLISGSEVTNLYDCGRCIRNWEL